MSVPKVEALRWETWENHPQDLYRLQALQDLENGLAAQEKREACEIKFFEGNIESGLMGEYVDQNKCIYINPNLVTSDEPYAAVETVFHESRHAYQAHIARHPDQAEDPAQAQDWQLTEQGGYLNYNQYGYNKYRWQPEEKDANQISRQRTEELYGLEFDDTHRYKEYSAEQQQQIDDDVFRAQLQNGKDYEKVARDEMIAHYNDVQIQTQKSQASKPDKELTKTETPNSTGENAVLSLGDNSSEQSEDNDYSYGYGL